MNARQLGSQSWAEARRKKDLEESRKDFRSWLPFVIGVWAAVILLLVKGFGQ